MPSTTTIGGSVLTRQVRRLSEEFARIREQEPVAEGREVVPVQYDDDDYVYFEVNIPGRADLEVDIAISFGRAVIRVRR